MAVSQLRPVRCLVTVLRNDLANQCIAQLRGLGWIPGISRWRAHGHYFLETGSSQRPSKVIYDRARRHRAGSARSIDWAAAFGDANWLHITGITPAISQSAADLTRKHKPPTDGAACELRFELPQNLWQYGKTAQG